MGNDISRRTFMKNSAIAIGAMAATGFGGLGQASAAQEGSRVFFTRDISSLSLMNIYARISELRKLPGKVAVKLHSGEPGGHHYPSPALIKDLVRAVNGTIVECNTAYPSIPWPWITPKAWGWAARPIS